MISPHPVDDRLLTYAEAAKILGTTRGYVERLVAQRRLAHVKLGHFVRIRRTDIDRLIETSRIPAATEER